MSWASKHIQARQSSPHSSRLGYGRPLSVKPAVGFVLGGFDDAGKNAGEQVYSGELTALPGTTNQLLGKALMLSLPVNHGGVYSEQEQGVHVWWCGREIEVVAQVSFKK